MISVEIGKMDDHRYWYHISVSELGCESELGDIENLITTYEAEVMSSGESIDEADAIININCVQIILLVKLTI